MLTSISYEYLTGGCVQQTSAWVKCEEGDTGRRESEGHTHTGLTMVVVSSRKGQAQPAFIVVWCRLPALHAGLAKYYRSVTSYLAN